MMIMTAINNGDDDFDDFKNYHLHGERLALALLSKEEPVMITLHAKHVNTHKIHRNIISLKIF